MRDLQTARSRAGLYRAIREFFDDAGYLETDTPNLARELIPEAHIPVFQTEHRHPFEQAIPYYLIPSPEVHMKRLVADGYGNIYRLGPSFRNAESRSHIHRPEFTMLEWYTINSDYRDSLELCQRLISGLADAGDMAGGSPILPACEVVTVERAFEQYAGAPPRVFDRKHGMRETALALDMRINDGESEEDLYQRIFLSFVEPSLPVDRPVFLTDYPSLVPSLATRHRDRPSLSERWELYINGVEIANCYTEERDRRRLERYLALESAACRASGSGPFAPPADSLLGFAQAPPCSGVALGVDRLLMVLLGLTDIAGVIFSE